MWDVGFGGLHLVTSGFGYLFWKTETSFLRQGFLRDITFFFKDGAPKLGFDFLIVPIILMTSVIIITVIIVCPMVIIYRRIEPLCCESAK